MKTVKKAVQQKIVLDEKIISPDRNIFLTIAGEDGNIIRDGTGELIEERPLSYDSELQKYGTVLIISPDLPLQYLRFYFSSPDHEIPEEYAPEDYRLIEGTTGAQGQEIVPLGYFIDYFLSVNTKADPLYKSSVENFIRANRTGVKSYISGAVNELETKTKLYFAERTVTESKDFYFDRFTAHLWQQAVNYPPVNEIVSFKLKYGSAEFIDISTTLLIHDRMMGTIEFLPVPGGDGSGLYSLLLGKLSGYAVSLLSHSTLERIPALFRITYKTGLFFSGQEEQEKEAVRQAVCRRALMKILPTIDPSVRMPSWSEGIDGVSTSWSYANDRMFQMFRDQEEEFCFNLKMKYGRNIDAIII